MDSACRHRVYNRNDRFRMSSDSPDKKLSPNEVRRLAEAYSEAGQEHVRRKLAAWLTEFWRTHNDSLNREEVAKLMDIPYSSFKSRIDPDSASHDLASATRLSRATLRCLDYLSSGKLPS